MGCEEYFSAKSTTIVLPSHALSSKVISFCSWLCLNDFHSIQKSPGTLAVHFNSRLQSEELKFDDTFYVHSRKHVRHAILEEPVGTSIGCM